MQAQPTESALTAILAIVREAAGDDVRFTRAVLAIARRDLQQALDEIQALDEPGRRVASYEELARIGARLSAAAALLAEAEEKEGET